MNNTECNSNSSSSPPDELLREMMPKLGLEAKAPSERYIRQARAQWFVPKLLVALSAILLSVMAAVLLTLPVRFRDVTLLEASDGAALDFRLDRRLLFESVTATLNDRPLYLTQVKPGVYHLEVTSNGELTVLARTFTGQVTPLTMTVDCVDQDPPFLKDDLVFGGYLYIYISDGTGENCSGVNWDSLQVTYIPEEGPNGAPSDKEEMSDDQPEQVEGVEVDEQVGFLRLPSPDRSVRIYVEDNRGNPFALRFDRS